MADVFSINTGFFRMDGGGIFGMVPRVLWEKQHPPDELNRISQALRSGLIIDGDRKMLVDVGLGHWPDEKFCKIYALDNSHFSWEKALAPYQLSPTQITDVILTHLHFDHAGGLVCEREGRFELIFPQATIWMQRRQWEWAHHPALKDRRSYLPPYLGAIAAHDRCQLLDGASAVTGSVSVMVFDGHTPGMQTVLVHTQEQICWFPADLIPMAFHLPPHYHMAFDNDPVLLCQEKESILHRAKAEQWTLFFYHEPLNAAATHKFTAS